ncbi:Os05g0382600, partial [Oryza sativa Japonica Group]
LVGLVSAYRYEGPRVSEETARAEAKALVAAVKSAGHAAAKLVENDDVVRILTTRSKPHLVETFKHYKEIHGRHIEEDLGHEETLREAALCLATPARYFSDCSSDLSPRLVSASPSCTLLLLLLLLLCFCCMRGSRLVNLAFRSRAVGME